LIYFDNVATVDPLVAVAAYDRGLAQFRIFPVADHGLRIWQPDHQTSRLPHHRRPVFRIEYRNFRAGQRTSHGSRLHRHLWVVDHVHQGFRQSIAIEQRDFDQAAPAFDDLRIDRLSGRDGEPKRGEVVWMHVFNDELAKLCGSGAEHSDPILGETLEAPLGIEAPVVEQDSGAAAPRAEQDAGAGLAPAGIRRTP